MATSVSSSSSSKTSKSLIQNSIFPIASIFLTISYSSFVWALRLSQKFNFPTTRCRPPQCKNFEHLTFQCKNFVSLKDSKEKDPEAVQAAVLKGLDKLKGAKRNEKKDEESDSEEEESDSEEEESESSNSDVDSKIERIIARRSGKKVTNDREGGKLTSKKKRKSDEDDDDGSDSDYRERKKRGRSKKRSSKKRGISDSDDDDESRKKRRK